MMIVEQLRYFIVDEEAITEAVQRRRAMDDVRGALGIAKGKILVADPPLDEGPAIVWQCLYESEHALAVAEAAITGSSEYAAPRNKLSEIVSRIEIELYTTDEDG